MTVIPLENFLHLIMHGLSIFYASKFQFQSSVLSTVQYIHIRIHIQIMSVKISLYYTVQRTLYTVHVVLLIGLFFMASPHT